MLLLAPQLALDHEDIIISPYTLLAPCAALGG